MLLTTFRSLSLKFITLCVICGIAIQGALLAEESFTLTSVEQVAAVPNPIKINLLTEESSIQPGRPFWVAFHFKIDPTWHAYWKNSGDTGYPLEIEWMLPQGITVKSIEWPVPHKKLVEAAVAFHYTDEVVLLAELIPDSSIAPVGELNISAKVKWLVCSEENCMPGNSHVKARVFVSKEAPQSSSDTAALFHAARAQLAKKDATVVDVVTSEDHVDLHVTLPKDSKAMDQLKASFYPETPEIVDDYTEVVWKSSGADTYVIQLKRKATSDATHPTSLKGLLVLDDANGNHVSSYELEATFITTSKPHEDIALADPYIPKAITTMDETMPIGLALGLAFLGGMILNLMPCVLPVVSLKILGFMQMAGQKRKTLVAHGVLFSAGVLVSFWIISGVLMGLQAYGHGVGWGFHLQQPLFVALLTIVFFTLALSLFGVFSVGDSLSSWAGGVQGKTRKGLWSTFFSGVLATVVATPCTGPFLGASIGLAATLGPAMGLLIFTSMGLGMASPYLALSAFPSLLKWIPKPGNWMVVLKEMMGFLMIATVLWLLWVFGAQTGLNGVIILTGALLLFAIGAWVYGHWGSSPLKKLSTRVVGIIVAAIFAIGGIGVVAKSLQLSEDTTIAMADSQMVTKNAGWEKYSKERLMELQKQGTPVIVDFTAKWCLTCQVNHLVFAKKEVAQAIQERGVVKMLADWTRYDATITEELKRFGRNSVPLYVLYPGNDNPPIVLPQMLTNDIVVQAIKEIPNVD